MPKKENKAKQTVVENKEIRLTVMIGQHDLETKARKAREFLEEGARVKVSLKFRGRELTRKDLGHLKLQQFFDLVKEVSEIQKEPAINAGRFLDMYLISTVKQSKKGGSTNGKSKDENKENLKPVKIGESDLFKAMKQIAETGNGPKDQIPSMGCGIKWLDN